MDKTLLAAEISNLQHIFAKKCKTCINENLELILVPKTNLYFSLKDVNSLEDLAYKVIAYCSRPASKDEPYVRNALNERYRKMVRDNINEFLGVEFTEEDWGIIYEKFGNGLNEDDCRKFIRSNFNLQLLKGQE